MKRKITLSNYITHNFNFYYLESFIPGYEDDNYDFTPGYQFTDLQCYSKFYKDRERLEPNNKYYKYNKAPIYIATHDNYIIGRGSWNRYSGGRISPIKMSEIISKRYNIPKTLLRCSITNNNSTLRNYAR